MLWSVAETSERTFVAWRAAITLRVLLLWLLVVPVTAPPTSAEIREDHQAELSALAGTLSDWILGQTEYSDTDLPGIQFKTQEGLEELCFPGFSHDLLPSIRGAYDARSVVVYLNTDFDFDSLLDISYLLHELVHHFQVQNVPRRSRDSKGAMEARALRMQMKWLEENGVPGAMTELGVDETTLRILEASPRYRSETGTRQSGR
ncbi:hypothetical protein BKP64_15610 [Marinobacter salinus]|uniref:DUF6647 domain-containing protein n=1 Tax=Marinobacter salinus TaxID=1874317 RepID=A0A1D9GQ05_9GAMM|nr:DUF6647 family protein [Marinobacter salinus]AOY89480.1 hypothetical protein BKP64_15610 [Marinobacter salinus]